ncbi:hypothetical protein NDU88_000835 [Pleurodeles waltl]|uniref:Uncharacterized protein n=1 Tax=Pleurodeles waltl TaxID=8319 RepID=A0AAV7L9B2_PLEWA|nr:hypothetical protein NDU88_000835 [Pleurodeles waltl]
MAVTASPRRGGARRAHALLPTVTLGTSRDITRRLHRYEGRFLRVSDQRARPPVVILVYRYATKTPNTRLMCYFVSWQRRRQETSESIQLRNEDAEYASYELLRFLATETPGNE